MNIIQNNGNYQDQWNSMEINEVFKIQKKSMQINEHRLKSIIDENL